ncbi:malto-oligosyltrehalose trehalohydrolase [Pseudotabrizicola algicola]|uniref:Malto-oligosyltrehalose trehalohydrolase n=1 Tax=Pseudotabrizicola algicola TaxID=2709381 RepID=A0A6B3RXR7_9RHOB|nr:malto-oligosyltrehalose trehalohydrolase [Pseudotabrizicola algicola]NEX47909.1 malto-oligosyltrehalose trehalohydrolase [Pseudotabrizicola algicola]
MPQNAAAALASDHSHDFAWGAVPEGAGRWRFRIWAPSAHAAAVQLGDRTEPMTKGADGFFEARLSAQVGDSYGFLVDGAFIPDPAARRQTGGVHDASTLADPAGYRWTTPWAGRPWHEAVVYELHIGTFTEEGTFRAARTKLAEIAELGFTAIEIMPVASFPGQRGWGYDGVLLFAPHAAYGTPEDMQAFVEAAQAVGLMVFLDVVYNHFGSEGAYLAPDFFHSEKHTPWGRAIDFSQPAVRQFFTDNALMWLRDYRLDGLRFDAVHEIIDDTHPAFMVELGQTVRGLDLGRPIHLILEDERNVTFLRDTGLYDAEWNDDFHHSVHVLLTGENHGHLAPVAVDPMADLLLALRDGQVRQGQDRGKASPPGEASGHLPPTAFVNAIQTHDQIGNRPQGERLITLVPQEATETAYAMLMLCPFIPMIFMGDEAGETTPFYFFADYSGELAEMTREGRVAEFGSPSGGTAPPDPIAPSTFRASRLQEADAAHAAHWRALTRELLGLRAAHVVPLLAGGAQANAEVVQTGPRSVRATWAFEEKKLTLHVNLGAVPDQEPDRAGALFSLRDTGTDPYALSIEVSGL